jgi:hypothetical protein
MKNNERSHCLSYFSCILIIIVFALTACREPKATTPSLTGTVSIDGTAAIGETLTANTDSLGGNGTISYRWKRGTGGGAVVNIGVNSNTYMVQAADEGSTITVTVTRSGYSGSKTSDPTTAVLPRLTGTVSISGIVKTGETLTANTDSLDGNGTISYRWMRGTGGDATVIGDSDTYVVQAADEGFTITVTVTRSGYFGSVSSETGTVLPTLTGMVSITGNVWVGETLTANTNSLDGNGDISYQWIREETGDGAAVIIGTNNNTYVVQAADEGFTITVTVTRSGYTDSVTSEPTAAVTLPPLTGSVTIRGTAEVGQTLTAITFLGGTGTISYQWNRGTDNIGANSTYIVRSADLGSTLTVTVSRAGYSGSLTSSPTLTVTAPPPPRTYDESVVKVEFTGTTKTVTFDDLSNNSIYLVKVNKSASAVSAAVTGSVQNALSFSSNSGLSSPLPGDELPPMGHPAATEFNANPPPIVRETFKPLADFIPPVVGGKRMFWVEEYYGNGNWVQKEATLLATGRYGNIWVVNNGITTALAQELSRNFDIIYPAETNILGFEYGGGPNGDGGKDGDPKIQILVYDITSNSGSAPAAGYFWAKDFYDNQPGTNKAEIFYVDAGTTRSSPAYIYSLLAHEFQHMINFNRKTVVNGGSSLPWYNEMLSLMTEDVMAGILGILPTNNYHPIQTRVPTFLDTYKNLGFTEWDTLSNAAYAKGYTFGAYLMRNYGGADILRSILANTTTNIPSITAALNEMSPGMTFEAALSRFSEAMICSGVSIPEGAFTFDKTVTRTITGYNGTYTYTVHAFDIWNTKRFFQYIDGPVVYSLTPMDMRPHSVLLQQSDAWINRSGTVSITLNRPGNANVELYLMVR